jgi:hypothetical protein
MTKRKNTSSSSSTTQDTSPKLNELPLDILEKIALEIGDHTGLRALSQTSRVIRSTLFELNPWAVIIQKHFPNVPVESIPKTAAEARRTYDGLINTEYFYFSPFMIELFTAVKNSDLRYLLQLIEHDEFNFEALDRYKDRHGRQLLDWVMIKQDPQVIALFQKKLRFIFKTKQYHHIFWLINHAKILKDDTLLTQIRPGHFDLQTRPNVLQLAIFCGQPIPLAWIQEDEAYLTHLQLTAEHGHSQYAQECLKYWAEQNSDDEPDILGMLEKAAINKQYDFLKSMYEFFHSKMNGSMSYLEYFFEAEAEKHKIALLCGNDESRQFVCRQVNNNPSFYEQHAVDLWENALMSDELHTLKCLLDIDSRILNEKIGAWEHHPIYYAIDHAGSYFLLRYLLNHRPELDEDIVYDSIASAIQFNHIHQALLLTHHVYENQHLLNAVKQALHACRAKERPNHAAIRAFERGLERLAQLLPIHPNLLTIRGQEKDSGI